MSFTGNEVQVEDAGQVYKLMTLHDFRKFRDLVMSNDSAWHTHHSDKVFTVQSKPPDDGSSKLNIIRARRIMECVSPETLYNQLHDARYRETWDSNMIEGYNIVKLNPHNDIGYYAAKFPWPLSNRDFCNMRSWMEFSNGDYIIFNHSVTHSKCPEKKGFVRGKSIISGYYIRPYNGDKGSELIYLTHSNLCGSIPYAIINVAMTKGAPMLLDRCEKFSLKYMQFVANTYPPGYIFPWKTPKMDWDSPYLFPEEELKKCKDSDQEPAKNSIVSQAMCSETTEGTARKCLQPVLPEVNAVGSVPTVSLAPVAPLSVSEPLCIQQYHTLMQDVTNAVDHSFLREGRVPSTREYLIRLKYFIDGIRRTTV